MGMTSGTHARDEKVINVLVEKPESKSPLGKPWRTWKDIRMEHTDIGW
jgi:hypothetical protein